MKPALVVPWAALAVVGGLHSALARERLAVLVSVEGDHELADNLSEVVIAKLSRSSEQQLVGQRELSERLLELETYARGGLRACVEDLRCLAGASGVADAKLAVIGRLAKEERRYSIELSLVEMQTGFRRAVVSESSPDDTERLIATVQEGVALLFDEGAERTKPPNRAEPFPEPRPKPVEPDLPGDLRTSAIIAWSSLGAALVALSAAIVARALRKRLLLAAATFGVAAVVAYLWH